MSNGLSRHSLAQTLSINDKAITGERWEDDQLKKGKVVRSGTDETAYGFAEGSVTLDLLTSIFLDDVVVQALTSLLPHDGKALKEKVCFFFLKGISANKWIVFECVCMHLFLFLEV